LSISALVARAELETIDVADGVEPQVALGDAGTLYVVYGKDKQILFTASHDSGKTFSKPVKIAEPPMLPLGMRRGPRIAVTTNAIVVTAITAQNPKKRQDGDINAWRSTDGGATWEDAGRVNDMIASAREGLHDLASDGENRLLCAWLDLRNDNKMQLYASLSRDGGVSWEENTRVYQSPDGHICECCHPSAAFDRKGNVYVMFRNWLDGNRDMYVTRSIDAKKFSEPTRLGLIGWKLNACPMDGGDLTIDPNNQPVAIWRQKNEIFLSLADSADHLVGAGRQPVVAVNQSGTYMAWVGQTGDLVVQLASGQPHEIAKYVSDPVLITAPESKSTYCLWESRGKILSTILKSASDHD
jgi:hypothetical protein